jgi:hypothetical protein
MNINKKLPEMKRGCRGEKWLQISGSMFLASTKNSVKV